jgi:protein-tyrosine kinase
VILKGVVKNLDILPSKPLNQDIDITNFFLGEEIENLLDKLKERYDLIILDTAPLAIATDAAVLSEYADGVVYVCGYNMVDKKKMLRAKKILDRAGANIYGVVVNKVGKNGYYYGEYDDYIYKHYDNYIEKNYKTINA